ncbi:uncharacterized protein LOC131620182 [Vicia villosa]|uniref:uncharacterized protein LOC131620182 n=1 Tax=Vicia villosa TaxID=3911 RepID=UPI00273B1100|nr:uncharacterized protein LOC131620182 [Vicia villosa]
MPVSTVRSMWGEDDMDFSFSRSEGFSGGLLSIWRTGSVTVLASFCGPGYLGSKLLWKGACYYIVNVYSSCSMSLKRVLWSRLVELKNKYQDGEWIIGGDFNAVMKRSERSGISSRSGNLEREGFADFIEDIGLVDVPCKGKRFSWFSGDGKSKSRIDRFLVSDNIISNWGVVGQWIGSRDVSDHCPVWLMEWEEIIVVGRGDFVLKEKFRLIKERLRWWEKNVFGKIDLEIEENVKVLNEWDDRDYWEEEVHLNKVKASKNIWFNLKLKENMLIQKSRLRWLNDGDDNSRFFHNAVKERRRRNRIGSLNTSDGVVNSVKEVKDAVKAHFESKFKEDCLERPLLDGIAFNSLSEEQSLSIEVPFP